MQHHDLKEIANGFLETREGFLEIENAFLEIAINLAKLRPAPCMNWSGFSRQLTIARMSRFSGSWISSSEDVSPIYFRFLEIDTPDNICVLNIC